LIANGSIVCFNCRLLRHGLRPVEVGGAALEMISLLVPVKLSGQTYFWPDKYPLRHISKIVLPTPAWYLRIKQLHFLRLYCTCSLELNAGKVEHTIQPQCSAK